MKVNTINGNDPEFKEKAERIYEIYNSEVEFFRQEELTVNNPETIYLIYIEGVEGGVLVDTWRDQRGNVAFHSVMQAGFLSSDRRKGYLKACIKHADIPIDTVQINGKSDPIRIWNKLGFVKSGTCGMIQMLSCKEIDGIDWQ